MIDERDLTSPVMKNIKVSNPLANERDFKYRCEYLRLLDSPINNGFAYALNSIAYFPQGAIREHDRKNYFHYTSLGNLENIINSGLFWASKLGEMNDSTEVTYAKNMLEMQLSSILRVNLIPEKHHALICANVSYYFSSFVCNDTYCVSFSKRGNLLSQWVKYAGNGGVSFSLHPLVVDELIKNKSGVSFVNVNYSLLDHYDTVERIATELSISWRILIDRDRAFDFLHENFKCVFFKIATEFKDPAFSEEEEVRILIDGDVNENCVGIRADGRKYISFNFRNGFLTAHSADLLYEYVFAAPTAHEKDALHKISAVFRRSKTKFGFIIGVRSPYIWPN